MIACPSCATKLPDGSRFCLSCGAQIAAQSALPEERKVVTTLFCDLVGFTAMSEAADPEDIDALLDEYSARARKMIESHCGTVEKFIGDAVVGVFGVPAVHEDDAERAVRAGLRIVEALEGMTWPDGSRLQVRAGVNTGEALVRIQVTPGSGERFLTGDAVNTAARLQAAAPPGGVAVGELAHTLVGDAVIFSELEPLALKGKSEPVRAWLATGVRSRTGLRTSGRPDTPFFGREAELTALQEALRDAVETGTSRFCLLVAEPGIGKSRLVLEFARALDAKPDIVTWRQGRCLPYGDGVTFWALSEIVKAQAGILDSDEVTTVEAKLEAVLPDDDDVAWLRQRLRPLLGLEASQASRGESFAAWRRFLESIAAGGPAVLVLEDLHWAGEAMLAFVEDLLSPELDAPLLIVGTARPQLLHEHAGPLTAEDDDRLLRLRLSALSKSEVASLVTDLIDAKPAKDLNERILGLAGGNPLYVEQYVRLLLDRGFLVPIDGGLGLEGDAQLPLPGTVHAVLAARLDTLSPEHKALLCDAAVIGETFWRGGVAALSGREASEVDAAMAELVARDFARPVVSSSMDGEAEFLFWHALARDVAYGQLPRKLRARKHEAAALWIERTGSDRADEFAEIAAYHYLAALDLANAVGDDELASSLVAPTIRSLAHAGDGALNLDLVAAERHFARALDLAGPGTSERLRLLPKLGEALLLRNRAQESAAAYEEAIGGLEARGEVRATALAMCWLANVHMHLGEPAGDLMQAAADLLADDGPSPEKAEVLTHHAMSLKVQDKDPRFVIKAAAGAIDVCELLALPEPALAMSCRGLARLDSGDTGGMDDYERALAAARAQGLGMERTTIEINYAYPVFCIKGARAAHDVLATGLDFARFHGIEAYVVAFRGALADNLRSEGEWDRALEEVSELVPTLDERGSVWDLLVLRSVQALVFACRGQPEKAVPFLTWIVHKGRESEVPWTKAYVLLAGAVVYLRLGETTVAAGLLAEWVETLHAARSFVDLAPEVVRTALACGHEGLAARVARELGERLPARRLPLQELVVVTVGGLLAEVHSERGAAVTAFATAASGWHDFGVPYEEGHALLGRGRCLVALGGAPEAAAPLAAGREIFARLGARPALEETEEVLRRASPA